MKIAVDNTGQKRFLENAFKNKKFKFVYGDLLNLNLLKNQYQKTGIILEYLKSLF